MYNVDSIFRSRRNLEIGINLAFEIFNLLEL